MNSILQQLKTTNDINGRKIAILMRHAERERIPHGEFGNDFPITKNGEKMALDFGKSISGLNVLKIISSPIPRCVQTAESIRKGMGKEIEIKTDNHLGDPGFHIYDADVIGKKYLEYGAKGVFEKFANGEKMLGLNDAEYLRTTAFDWLKSQTKENGITIFVTHDALISHFAHANGIKKYSKENWVDFLDGIIVEL